MLPPAKTMVKKVVVQQEENQKGIVARINKITAEDKRLYFGLTDDQGTASPNQPCDSSDRFEAEPTLPAFLKGAPKPCGEVLTFIVASAHTTYAMALLGDEAMKAGDFAKAQLYYANAAERLSATSISESLLLSNQAKIAAGKSLGSATPTINVNGEEVFTDETLAKLSAFQASRSLAVSGKLDAATAQALGGLDKRDVLTRATAVPPRRLEVYRIDPAVIRGSRAQMLDEPRKSSGGARYDLKAMIDEKKGHEAKATGLPRQ